MFSGGSPISSVTHSRQATRKDVTHGRQTPRGVAEPRLAAGYPAGFLLNSEWAGASERARLDDLAAASREGVAHERDESSSRRDESSLIRDESSSRRDESSALRDKLADALDRAATDLDAQDEATDGGSLGVEELRGRSRSGRTRAAADRARSRQDRRHAQGDRGHAGSDREHSGEDREHAGADRGHAEDDRDHSRHDRDHAGDDREHAGTDELTGARRRGVGLEQLENEIGRARRESESRLVAAFVDVDGLKSVNDLDGHAAGDALLLRVADGLRLYMRSYDLLVRLGGDEFLCALPNLRVPDAHARFEGLQGALAKSGASVSVGYAELRDGDSARDLVDRADGELLATRGPHR